MIPANAQLPDRNPKIKAWNALTPEEKKLYARFLEVYAGYLAYTDYEISRLVNHLKENGELDNTLIFISIGDNGASKEGTLNGDIDRSLATPPLPSRKTSPTISPRSAKSALRKPSRATTRSAGRRRPTRRSSNGSRTPTPKAARTTR